jgi:hypothetical protein
VVVVENIIEGDELRTDVAAIAAHIERLGPECVACVVTTTSCFAPRGADRVVEVVRMSRALGARRAGLGNPLQLQPDQAQQSVFSVLP